MRRLLFLFALVLAGSAAAKDPPPGRPAFDLSLLTRPPDGGMMAFRPAELIAHAGVPDDGVTGYIGQIAKAGAAFIDGELKAENLPAASSIEQVVLGLNLSLKLSTTEEQGTGTLSLQGSNFGYIRTTEKFDWAGIVKKTFPKAVTETHAGREYLSCGIKFGTFEVVIGFYVPDERTLVFDVDVEKLEAALATWEERKRPAMPAGWDDVKGCSVAFVMPMGDRKWMTTAGKLNENGLLLKKLAKSLKSACVGMTFGDTTTTAVGVFAAISDDAAFKVEGQVNKSLTAAEEGLGEKLAGKATATTTRTGKTVRVQATVKANALKDFVRSYDDDGKE
jgi:hypothetical protein